MVSLLHLEHTDVFLLHIDIIHAILHLKAIAIYQHHILELVIGGSIEE